MWAVQTGLGHTDLTATGQRRCDVSQDVKELSLAQLSADEWGQCETLSSLSRRVKKLTRLNKKLKKMKLKSKTLDQKDVSVH